MRFEVLFETLAPMGHGVGDHVAHAGRNTFQPFGMVRRVTIN